MKSLIRKLLTGNNPIREYATITIEDEIKERVYLETSRSRVNVSQHQFVLCLEPLVFGIWITNEKIIEELNREKTTRLVFEDSPELKNKTAIAYLEFFSKIEEPGGTLFLMVLKKSSLYHPDLIRVRLLFHRYYKKRAFNFEKFKSFVTAYSYPRKVRVISFTQNEDYNIFPMDLVGELRSIDRMVFGLRHTNRTLSKMIEAKKLVASEVPSAYKEMIYKLGSHHSTAPPLMDELPFKTIRSKTFGFYIPDWAESYKEIEILQTVNLGSHMLMWGKIVNETILKPLTNSLYHIHFIHWLHEKKIFEYKKV